jgi:hypothetical protein
MRRGPALSLTIAGLAGVSVFFAPGVLAGPAPKAFPPGCWKGTGVFGETLNKGALKAKVTNGKLKFGLIAGKGPKAIVLGAMDTGGHGSGSFTTAGTKISMEVEMVGDYTMYGTPASPKVKGQQRWTGSAVYRGTKIPVDFKLPVHGVPMTITTVSASKVSGFFGKPKSKWTAGRIAKPGLSGQQCLKAAGV